VCVVQDFYNLVDVYLDAVLHPKCVNDKRTFEQVREAQTYLRHDRLSTQGFIHPELHTRCVAPLRGVISFTVTVRCPRPPPPTHTHTQT